MDIKDLQEQAYKRGYADAAKNIRIPANCGNCGNYDSTKGEFTEACGVCKVMHGGASAPSEYKAKLLTNADRIRAMTDEELVDFIEHFNICDIRTHEECLRIYCANCEVCMLDWLQQPAEVDDYEKAKSGD